MSHFPQTSRSKAPPAGNEEASSTISLGEFQDVDTLTLSEAALVINALVAKRRIDHKNINETDYCGEVWLIFVCAFPASRMLTKTVDYLDAFSRFKKKENVEAVERLLSAHKEFHKFERAQLGSLCCETAEEAKTLIPSLTDKISDEDLQELLDEMYKLMPR
ncbi:Uu.00g014360.m01.CDS01 [Anthostomella pinea]|uniref:Uu.00g014360.m01.CDS01 n=1 Tax=Anthostomella pinea TaxID=933095 RepID=A0AAI8VYC9_9PEZI|nr:Uu.00g014360.m01.CDS01 [Anthostomella pinea]